MLTFCVVLSASVLLEKDSHPQPNPGSVALVAFVVGFLILEVVLV